MQGKPQNRHILAIWTAPLMTFSVKVTNIDPTGKIFQFISEKFFFVKYHNNFAIHIPIYIKFIKKIVNLLETCLRNFM